MPRKRITAPLVNMLMAATGTSNIDYSLWDNPNFIAGLRDIGYDRAWDKYKESLMELQQVLMDTEEGRESLKRVMPTGMYEDLLYCWVDNNSPEIDLDDPNHQRVLVRLTLMKCVSRNIDDIWESDPDDEDDLLDLIGKTFGFDFSQVGLLRIRAWLNQNECYYKNLDNLIVLAPERKKRAKPNRKPYPEEEA